MSVLIKGLKMPEKCGSCDLFHVESPMHCTVVKGHKTVGAPYGMPRPDWCPLVEIPEPHGDLIDRDAPEIVFCKDCRKHNVKVGFDENFHTVWKEDACPLVDWRGKAKEHEFDYQYCAFAERRTDGKTT